MSDTTKTVDYSIDADFETLERDLLGEITRAMPKRDGQLHTDVTFLGVLIGTLAGMLGSYIVNSMPTWKDVGGKLNREQILQIESSLRKATFRLNVSSERRALIAKVEAQLPQDIVDRRTLSEKIVDRVLSHFRPK